VKLSHHYANALPELVSPVKPQPLKGMRTAMVNEALASSFAISPQEWQQDTLLHALFKKDSALHQHAVAQKYGGHQFGQWNPQLGDGRGLLLGERQNQQGEWFDLHLKGAGQTPYSRHADGRAVLRSTIREYLGSEALHHMGIPSSRSLCLFSSEQQVMRERPELGAMMIRMAPSHIRFGHFEYYCHSGQKKALDDLMNFCLAQHFVHCQQATNPHLAMLTEITKNTARMLALWQTHGFVHGVMNTDNMSIHGITFDYGPYAFVDDFKPSAVFNHSDYEGRYAFDRQPGVALWNLNALAHGFMHYCSSAEITQALQEYEPCFIREYQSKMLLRLGIHKTTPTAITVMNQWLNMLAAEQLDYHSTFRVLAMADITQAQPDLRDHFIHRPMFDQWWPLYQEAREHNHSGQQSMLQHNPVMVLRTHYLQQAIAAANQGDYSIAESLMSALKSPYADNELTRHWSAPPAKSQQPGMLSCSS
jgi:uncharacterized protein YdiU (UPF0061 family)